MPSLSSDNYRKYKSLNPFVRIGVYSFLKEVLRLVNGISPKNLLDAGCGEGFVMRYLWDHYKGVLPLTGFDMDYNAISQARSINPGQHLAQASIYNMPFRDKSFDLVICLEVLEHLTRVDGALAEISRVARGDCIISVPFEPYFSICRALSGKDFFRLGRNPDHINYLKMPQMKEKLANGFILEKTLISFPWIIFWAKARQ